MASDTSPTPTLEAIEQACHQGFWSYSGGKQASLEATAMCAIACRKNSEIARAATDFLLSTQNKDGGWTTVPKEGRSDWSSSLGLLALNALSPHLEASQGQKVRTAQERAVEFLVGSRANRNSFIGNIFLILWKGPDWDFKRGWTWAPKTYNWAEPTAYAVMALSTSPDAHEQEVDRVIRLAQQFLEGKACAGGGWNYGCPHILGADLPAQAAVSPLVLTCLQGLPAGGKLASSFAYIDKDRADKKTTLVRSWTAICKSAWDLDMTKVMSDLQDATTSNSLVGKPLFAQALSTIANTIATNGNPFKYATKQERP